LRALELIDPAIPENLPAEGVARLHCAAQQNRSAKDRDGSYPEVAILAFMSASAGCGHAATQAYFREVPILLQKS
jgi:hypothetical protein